MNKQVSSSLIYILTVTFMIIMIVFSLLTLVGINLGGVTVIGGIFAFFFIKFIHRLTLKECGLGVRSISKSLNIPILIFVLLPTLLNILVIMIANELLPDYITHIQSRSSAALVLSTLPITIGQLIIFACFEEIAWRGFFQKTLMSFTKMIPAILLTSIIFSLGHYFNAPIIIVIYDLFFILINSMIYGYLFVKSKNLWISTLSHVLANIAAIMILFFI